MATHIIQRNPGKKSPKAPLSLCGLQSMSVSEDSEAPISPEIESPASVKERINATYDKEALKCRTSQMVQNLLESLATLDSRVGKMQANFVMNRIKKWLSKNQMISTTLQKTSAASLSPDERIEIYNKISLIPPNKWNEFIYETLFTKIALRKSTITSDIIDEDDLEFSQDSQI